MQEKRSFSRIVDLGWEEGVGVCCVVKRSESGIALETSKARQAMIGGIKERTVSNARPTEPSAPRVTGFPKAEHRSKKSAFLQRRQASTETAPSPAQVPISPNTLGEDNFGGDGVENPLPREEDMMAQISRENARRIAAMSEDEVQAERNAIIERFGTDIVEKLRNSREAQLQRSATPPQGERGGNI